MQLLDGRAAAERWRTELSSRVVALKGHGITPGLAVVLVGDDPGSLMYTAMKERASRELGFFSAKETLPVSTTTRQVVATVQKLNADPKIHGILVQLPLPAQVDTDAVLEALDPRKDADGLHPKSLGDLLIGHEWVVPATPRGILRLLEESEIPTEGRHVVIVGRSNILGKPLAALFLNRNATVTICHSKTRDLTDLTRLGDIVVMDTGVPGLLRGDMVRPEAVIIDAGITKTATGAVVGDAQFDQLKDHVSAMTPVPGGVGPMTIAALLANTIDLAERSRTK